MGDKGSDVTVKLLSVSEGAEHAFASNQQPAACAVQSRSLTLRRAFL